MELDIEDVYRMVGQMVVNSALAQKETKRLQDEVTRLTTEVNELRRQVAEKVITVEAQETQAA